MARQGAQTHKLRISHQNQDTTTAESMSFEMPITGDFGTAAMQFEPDNDLNETGRTGFLSETADTVIFQRVSRNVSAKPTPESIGVLSFLASHPGAAASADQTLNTNKGTLNYWTGNLANLTARSATVEDLGIPGTSDANLNKTLHNCVCESFTLSGQRGGLFNMSASLVGGGNVVSAGAGSGPSFAGLANSRHWNFSTDFYLQTSSTLGLGASIASKLATLATTAPSQSAVTTSSLLQSTDSSHRSLCYGVEVTLGTSHDVTASQEADGNPYIGTSGQWEVTGRSIGLKLTFRQGESATKTLIGEYEAGTRRAWEVLLIGSTAINSGVYPLWSMSGAAWKPVPGSFSESAGGPDQAKMVSISYEASVSTTDVQFAHSYGDNTLGAFGS